MFASKKIKPTSPVSNSHENDSNRKSRSMPAVPALQQKPQHKNESVVQGKAASGEGIVQRYKNKSYRPNLTGLQVPVSKFDKQAFSSDAFDRPSGWYENTFESLFAVANKFQVENKFTGHPVWLVQCGATGQVCTTDGLDIGHKTNWETFVANTQPETMREAYNAYNDLNNLRLESASANRSHDFELSTSSNFKDLPGIDDFGSGKEAKKKRDKFVKQYEGIDIDSYDLDDSFIDDSEYKKETFVTRSKIWLTDEGGLNSGVGGWFEETTVTLSKNVRGRYMEVTILSTTDERLKNYEGRKLWGNLRNLKKGEVVTY